MKTNKKLSSESSCSGPAKQHKISLEKLKTDDPEFYDFLKEEDKNLLNFPENESDESDIEDDRDDVDESGKSDDEVEDEEIDKIAKELDKSDSEEEPIHQLPDKLEEFEPPSDVSDEEVDDDNKETSELEKIDKPKIVGSGRVTLAVIKRWTKLLQKKPTVSLFHDVTQAFKIAVSKSDSDNAKGSDSLSSVNDAAVLNALTQLCVSHMLPVMLTLLGHSRATGRLDKPSIITQSKGWKHVRSDVKSYLGDVLKVMSSLSQSQTLTVILKHILSLTTFFSCFPIMSRNLLKRLVKNWSVGEEKTRVVAFLCVSRLVRIQSDNLLELAIKKMYIAYVRNTKFTSPTTLPSINFMRRTLVEILAVNDTVSYRYAFVYIRQLAIHLRNAITNHKMDQIALVYNWQYIHSLALWARLLCDLCPGSCLDALIYPLTQTIIGVIKLVPTQKFYPLRFHCVRLLILLSDSTHTYIPVLPFILEVFEQTDFNRRHKKISLQPFTFATILKFSKSQITEKAFKDGVVDQVYELLIEFLHVYSHSIAFPELSLPAIIQLKDFMKKCKVANFCKLVKQIVDKIQETNEFITDRRKSVSFSVSDSAAIDAWEQGIKLEGTPISKYYTTWRKMRDTELQYEISGKDQLLADINIPTIDRSKFKRKATDEEKEEFSALFENDSDENDSERFLVKEERPSKVAKKDTQDQSDEDYSDLDSDELEMLDRSASDNESEEENDEETDVQTKTQKTINPEEVSKRMRKLLEDNPNDIVEDFNLTSSDDEDSA